MYVKWSLDDKVLVIIIIVEQTAFPHTPKAIFRLIRCGAPIPPDTTTIPENLSTDNGRVDSKITMHGGGGQEMESGGFTRSWTFFFTYPFAGSDMIKVSCGLVNTLENRLHRNQRAGWIWISAIPVTRPRTLVLMNNVKRTMRSMIFLYTCIRRDYNRRGGATDG